MRVLSFLFYLSVISCAPLQFLLISLTIMITGIHRYPIDDLDDFEQQAWGTDYVDESSA